MIVYEVNLEVDEDIKFNFAGWLPAHMNRMLEIEGFDAAYWFFRMPEDEGKPADKTLWTIQYIVDSREALDAYLTNQAPAMQEEALQRFGDKFLAQRRILNLLSGPDRG